MRPTRSCSPGLSSAARASSLEPLAVCARVLTKRRESFAHTHVNKEAKGRLPEASQRVVRSRRAYVVGNEVPM